MYTTDIVSTEGIFRGCTFYVQERDRPPLDVKEDIRFLRMCGGTVAHHPLNQNITHYIVGLKTEKQWATHPVKSGNHRPALGKDFTVEDLLRVAMSCQGQITVVQSAWIAECRERNRLMGPVEDCGGWLVKQASPPAILSAMTTPQVPALVSPLASSSHSGSPVSAPVSSSGASVPTPPKKSTVGDQVTSPAATSLFSPPGSPAHRSGLPSLSEPLPHTDDVSSTAAPPVASVKPRSTSSNPSFLKDTSHRARSRPPVTTKAIPNSARVRNNTIGELEKNADYRGRRRSRVTQTPIGLKNPPVNPLMKRPRLDLSRMKFSKISRPGNVGPDSTPTTPSASIPTTKPSLPSRRSTSTAPPSPSDTLSPSTTSDQSKGGSVCSSRSSSPEVPLSGWTHQHKLSNKASPAPSSSSSVPYPSPTSALTPLESISETQSPCHDVFLDPDGSPLRFYLDDSCHSHLATDILVSQPATACADAQSHGGEFAPDWDSSFVVTSRDADAGGVRQAQYGTKGRVTSCPRVVSYQWVKECLRAGKLLPTQPFIVKV